MEFEWLAIPGLIIWTGIILLPWRPWSVRESLDAGSGVATADLAGVTVIIPARNEQDVIGTTLSGLATQGTGLRIVLVDDQSTDATISTALQSGLDNLRVIPGTALPTGWSGKLWALEQGRTGVTSEYILLLDADIELRPGTIAALLDKMNNHRLHFVSLMACLRMESLWEKLLMPAFIFFFKLLYPFHLSNSASRLIAAAAGGCILIKTNTLNEIGGFSAIKDELIDDCALARRVKDRGHRTWIGLTHSAISQRRYDTLNTIWEMVTRTAFTQLKYSLLLLLLCTLLMAAAFIMPIAAFATLLPTVMVMAACSLTLMIISYLPTLNYYGKSRLWALTLPVIGAIYLLMTWSSAVNHWIGTGAQWKQRAYKNRAG